MNPRFASDTVRCVMLRHALTTAAHLVKQGRCLCVRQDHHPNICYEIRSILSTSEPCPCVQMQWLLRLIRGAAGDARSALAVVPESVVRDAAGWLIFVVRWGHADLLGGCDIAGLVQVGCTLACSSMSMSRRT